MEKQLDFLNFLDRDWLFVWDQKQQKLLDVGTNALQTWQWYERETGQEHWQLVFPFKSGILQSAWALDRVLTHFFQAKKLQLRPMQALPVLVATANSQLEQQKIYQLVVQHSLRPVNILTRAQFFNQYLQKHKNFSRLKLIVDVLDNFVELSLFLDDELLKNQFLPLASGLDKKQVNQNVQSFLDRFLLNLPRDLFAASWQYFYVFLDQQQPLALDLDQLNQQLKMEAIIHQQPIKSYV